jgi:hypothetical protein
MILFISQGRLGNQLFQYAFLQTIREKNEKILVLGFSELKEVFYTKGIVNFPYRRDIWTRVSYKLFIYLINFLVSVRMISSINVDKKYYKNGYSCEGKTTSFSRGLFKNITFVLPGFFQSQEFFEKRAIDHLRIKEKFSLDAKKIFSRFPKNSYYVFIHLRRGDYLDFKVFDKNTLLPLRYFNNQIQWFVNNKKNPFFIFISDDSSFIRSNFSHVTSKHFMEDNHFGTDLSIMTLCNGAILSPSSFGWWGSYLMKKRDKVFAPKFWLGFESKINFPSCTTPNYCTSVEI